MDKKLIIIICLIIFILFIGFIIGIRTIRNFCVIQNIFSEVNENIKKDNYYLRTKITHNGETKITKIYYKENTGKMVSENGIYTWTDGKEAYLVDELEKKAYKQSINDSTIGLVSNEMFASLIPGYGKKAFEKFIMAGNLHNSITSEILNEKRCYKIKILEENVSKIYWIEKNSKKPLKAIIEFENGDRYEYDYELQFNVAKYKDIELPDFTEYTIDE